MKKIAQLLAIAVVAVTLTSCHKERVRPSHDITSMTHILGGYDKIVVSGATDADISFTTGTEQVVVETNSNLHPYVVTQVVGNTLYLHMDDNVRIRGSYTLKIHVSAQDFSSIDVSGASNCKINSTWITTFAGINVSGASKLAGSVNSNNMEMEISGASNVDLSGINNTVNMELSGASSFDYFSFICNDLTARLSGASKADLTVNNSLVLDLSGASILRYMGSGSITDITTSGASKVEHL